MARSGQSRPGDDRSPADELRARVAELSTHRVEPDRVVMLHRGSGHEVVGEANFQPALRRLAGRLEPDGVRGEHRLVEAELSREPDNPHDADAVRVSVDGRTVGYIPHDKASDYHDFLDWAASGGFATRSRAHLVGGFRLRTGQQARLGIYLDHEMPPVVQYDGPAPTVATALGHDRRSWRDISLVGEEQAQAVIASMRFRLHLVSLVGVDDRVEVHLGAVTLGSLTTKMADRYGEAIRRQAARDQADPTTLAKAVPGGSKLEVFVKLPVGDDLARWAAG